MVNGKEVHMLVGSGSTHKFINEKVVKALEIKIEPTTPIVKFNDIFQEPQSMPPVRNIEHMIELRPDAIPKKQQPYRYAYGQKTEIENIVRGMLKSGIIQEMIDELLDELHGAKYFSKIDLRSGYLQIRMRDEDVSKTSFITHSGHYEFLVMPLCNAPSTFQALMNHIFEPFLRKFVLVFFDDMLVYNKGWIDHFQHLRGVLELLRSQELYANKSKYSFAQQQVEYLAHVISVEGVATDPQKVQCMVNWPVSTTIKALRGFLGLTGYYRKFIKGYRKWNEEAEVAFSKLKEVMCSTPVLASPDFTKPFVVETDACGKGIVAVLMQEASIAKIFFDNIYKFHGLPVSIVIDRDKVFTSHFWRELFGLTRVSLDMSSAYHPQTDGQTERINQGLKITPFQALYGYPPNQLAIRPYLQRHHSKVDELMQSRVKSMQLLKENLLQHRMKTYVDKKRNEREFQVGDEMEGKSSVGSNASALRRGQASPVNLGSAKDVERDLCEVGDYGKQMTVALKSQ
ncbi:UNVERIFIED_CONTAM: Retrovirus-related Pol polyprotein from transposon.6 [Sesamum calycinum]|uniref:Retrovirus-related Pol polyprotein from transposon.6 n=1 Tax=Sesamum calycinum TaxID=2727403 RepID=A0AAW2LS95_9LAMI